MKTITEFNPKTLPNLRATLNKALTDLGDQIGLSIAVGNMRYDAHSVTIKLEATLQGQPTAHERGLDQFTNYKVNDVIDVPNKILKNSGNVVVKGFNPKARRYPLMVTSNGKWYNLVYNFGEPYPVITIA